MSRAPTEALDDGAPVEKYQQLYESGRTVAEMLSRAVVTPAAKEFFRRDRGHPLNQTLPDRGEEYEFESNGFSALVLPSERRVVNQSYNGKALSATSLADDPDRFSSVGDDAQSLWSDAFGKWRQMARQPDHPGPFPVDEEVISGTVDTLSRVRAEALEAANLSVAAEAARNEDFSFLAEMFGTSHEQIHTPGSTDLSAVRYNDGIEVPYNDGDIAVLRPAESGSGGTRPTRGVIIGHDDTPVGVFAHAVDVTHLSPEQQTTHAAIRDAMGFDREIDPFDPPEELSVGEDERIRLQGDLRIERTGDLDTFPDELAGRRRIELYEEAVEEILEGLSIPSDYLTGRRSDARVSSAFSVEATRDGEFTLEPTVSDGSVELLAHAEVLMHLDDGPAAEYHSYESIPHVVDEPGDFRVLDAARTNLRHDLRRAREEVRQSVAEHVERQRDRIEQEARNVAADAEAGIDVPKQVNLPIDNHMAFVQAGFAPDVDTEPVPVAVPEETTLHIIHDEHNTVNVQIDPGVYRFSLLPRGLQPPGERPQWERP